MYSVVSVLCRRAIVVDPKVYSRMSTTYSYEDAVRQLNSLQSNKATIDQIRRDILAGQQNCTNIEDMENYLLRTGLTLSKLDQLSVIHVAGTKGKGTTSAMCESILRHHGYKTGFFSSPHLVAVCERIRLEGQVISKEKFAKYFHRVFNLLNTSKAHEGDMPKYFAFLTVMAYNVFLEEKVDVAIVEVGIGGVVDYTNVLRKVPVVGITALGLDHTSILGNTIEQIAAAKAGIMKPSCEAYTVEQSPEAMNVLLGVAKKIGCPLYIAPQYKTYNFSEEYKNQLHVDINASLAIQLAHAWIRIVNSQTTSKTLSLRTQPRNEKNKKRNELSKTDSLTCGKQVNDNDDKYNKPLDSPLTSVPKQTLQGLRDCRWPGRYQEIRTDYAQFYLDGAHTKESVEICASWFMSNTLHRPLDKILIFSATGDRDAEVLLKPLKDVGFSKVYFVIPTAYRDINEKSDNYSAIEQKDLTGRCENHAGIWKRFHSNLTNTDIKVMQCVSDALIDIKQSNVYSSVLITGSLHLVGASLSILDRNLSKE